MHKHPDFSLTPSKQEPTPEQVAAPSLDIERLAKDLALVRKNIETIEYHLEQVQILLSQNRMILKK